MFALSADPTLPKPELYRELGAAADALTAGESDGIANMANIAALIWQLVPELNWAGFYRVIGDELVLGPFCGKPACIRIRLRKSVMHIDIYDAGGCALGLAFGRRGRAFERCFQFCDPS